MSNGAQGECLLWKGRLAQGLVFPVFLSDRNSQPFLPVIVILVSKLNFLLPIKIFTKQLHTLVRLPIVSYLER